MKGRVDPLLNHQALTWMRKSLEHRRWPPPGSHKLGSWGNGDFQAFWNHFAPLLCMRDFDMREALHQFFAIEKRTER
jgi:hypothetical protein